MCYYYFLNPVLPVMSQSLIVQYKYKSKKKKPLYINNSFTNVQLNAWMAV